MKKYLIISVISIFLFSCNRKTVIQDIKRDSIVYKEVVKLDTSYLQMPSDTFYYQIPIDCPDIESKVKDGIKQFQLSIKNKVLKVYYTKAADSIAIINAFKKTSEFESRIVMQKNTETIYKTPKWAWYFMAISFGFNLLIGLILWFKFR